MRSTKPDKHKRAIGTLMPKAQAQLHQMAQTMCKNQNCLCVNGDIVNRFCDSVSLTTPHEVSKHVFGECMIPSNVFSPDTHIIGDYVISPTGVSFLPSNATGVFVDVKDVPEKWSPCQCIINKLRFMTCLKFAPGVVNKIARATGGRYSAISKIVDCHPIDLRSALTQGCGIKFLRVRINNETTKSMRYDYGFVGDFQDDGENAEAEDSAEQDEKDSRSGKFEAAWLASMRHLRDCFEDDDQTRHIVYPSIRRLYITVDVTNTANLAPLDLSIMEKCPNVYELMITGLKFQSLTIPRSLTMLYIFRCCVVAPIELHDNIRGANLEMQGFGSTVRLDGLGADCKLLHLKNLGIKSLPRPSNNNMFGRRLDSVAIRDCWDEQQTDHTNWLGMASPTTLIATGESSYEIAVMKNPSILNRAKLLFIHAPVTITGWIGAKTADLRLCTVNAIIGSPVEKLTIIDATIGNDMYVSSPNTITTLRLEKTKISCANYEMFSSMCGWKKRTMRNNTLSDAAEGSTVIVD